MLRDSLGARSSGTRNDRCLEMSVFSGSLEGEESQVDVTFSSEWIHDSIIVR